MNQYRSHLKWCVYFTPPTTNKTTPPINLGVWLFFYAKKRKKFIKRVDSYAMPCYNKVYQLRGGKKVLDFIERITNIALTVVSTMVLVKSLKGDKEK